MKCLKCESLLLDMPTGESKMMKGLEYVACTHCGNVMMKQGGVLTNTPETDGPMTRLLVNDAAEALKAHEAIFSLNGKDFSPEMQSEKALENIENFVNSLFAPDETEDPDVQLKEFLKSLPCAVKVKIIEEETEREITENNPDLVATFNAMKRTGVLGTLIKKLIQIEEDNDNSEDIMREIANLSNRKASEVQIHSKKSMAENIYNDLLLKLPGVAQFLPEEKLREMADKLVEDITHIESVDDLDRASSTRAKELFDLVRSEMFEAQNTANDEMCAALHCEANNSSEKDNYIVARRDGTYVELNNKTKQEVTDYLNSDDNNGDFKIYRTEPVELRHGLDIKTIFQLK